MCYEVILGLSSVHGQSSNRHVIRPNGTPCPRNNNLWNCHFYKYWITLFHTQSSASSSPVSFPLRRYEMIEGTNWGSLQPICFGNVVHSSHADEILSPCELIGSKPNTDPRCALNQVWHHRRGINTEDLQYIVSCIGMSIDLVYRYAKTKITYVPLQDLRLA